MTAVTPVPRTRFVDAGGLLSLEGRNFLQSLLSRTGGVGTVVLTQADIVGSVVDELVKFNADGQLTNSGIVSSGGGLVADAEVQGVGLVGRQVTTVNFSDLSSGLSKAVFTVESGDQWQVTDIFLSGDGTNFSGGDRTLEVYQDTAVYSNIPAATLQSLGAARWGSAGVPFPAVAADLLASATGSISVRYAGGTTDYTAGQCTIVVLAERIV